MIYRKLISPWLGPRCRFYPSCSAYAEEVITKKDFLPGLVLSLKRLAKCQPFHPGGFDFVD